MCRRLAKIHKIHELVSKAAWCDVVDGERGVKIRRGRLNIAAAFGVVILDALVVDFEASWQDLTLRSPNCEFRKEWTIEEKEQLLTNHQKGDSCIRLVLESRRALAQVPFMPTEAGGTPRLLPHYCSELASEHDRITQDEPFGEVEILILTRRSSPPKPCCIA